MINQGAGAGCFVEELHLLASGKWNLADLLPMVCNTMVVRLQVAEVSLCNACLH